MTSLSQLIAAVERAEGADRELDCLIWLEVEPRATRDKWSYVHKATGRTCEVDETRDASRRLITVPAYTASLDAAMSLVGDNHWRVEDHPMAGPCALVDDHEGYATTPALALVCAALRAHEARAAMEGR